jgi:IrrE N-terminal-like domain
LADFLPSTLGFSRPPVDLFAVARHRHIRHLGLRFMVPRAMLLPVEGGFEVYLRNSIRKDIDISQAESVNLLSPWQRFSLAHEVAHTYFYNFSDSVPAPDSAAPNPLELEKSCDRTAGHILVPTSLLKRAIGDYQRIDAALVRSVAVDFRTSLEVMIDRLCMVEPSNPLERCVLLARRLHGDAEIRASYFGVGLLPILRRPEKYTRLTDWLADFPRRAIDKKEDSDWGITRMGRPIKFTKTEVGASGDFLLQVQASR